MILNNLFFAGVALFAAANLPTAFAQATSNATCQAQYQWMINSRGQTPCLASAYLSGQCNSGQWNVPALTNSGPYSHPEGDAANLCRCNTVTYNLIQACSVCQGGNIGGWLNWITNCTAGNTTVGRYPLGLPGGVAVPGWAYLDFTTQDQFQTQAAQQAAGSLAESSSVSGSTQVQTSYTGSATYVSASRTTGGWTATASPTNSGASSSSNTGAIAGGIVGGVLGIALVVLIGFFLLRKKASKTDPVPPMQEHYPSHAYTNTSQSGHGYETGYPVQQPYGAGNYTPVPATTLYDPYSVTPTPYKPYDPSDPTTFPATPAPGTAPTVHSHSTPYSEAPYSEYAHQPQQQPRPGQYNYAAEL